MTLRPSAALLVTACLTPALAACSPYSTGVTVDGNRALERVPDDQDYAPTDAEIEQAQREGWEKATGDAWLCFYEPTMNEDWYDDVVCTDGPTQHRPSLLVGEFVTEDMMRAEAARYEAQLNGGGSLQ